MSAARTMRRMAGEPRNSRLQRQVVQLILDRGLGPGAPLPTEAELMDAIFPHPTLSEMMHESVLDAYGRAIHI